jgi:hypothetical protein
MTEISMSTQNTNTLLIMAGIVAVVDVVVFFLVRAAFQREEILTKGE